MGLYKIWMGQLYLSQLKPKIHRPPTIKPHRRVVFVVVSPSRWTPSSNSEAWSESLLPVFLQINTFATPDPSLLLLFPNLVSSPRAPKAKARFITTRACSGNHYPQASNSTFPTPWALWVSSINLFESSIRSLIGSVFLLGLEWKTRVIRTGALGQVCSILLNWQIGFLILRFKSLTLWCFVSNTQCLSPICLVT